MHEKINVVVATDMDIEQLITSLDRLKNKDNELEQKIDSKKRALDTINTEISKEKQRLEEKVKELARSVETKLKESEKIDNDLSTKSSVLARMQKARNIQAEEAASKEPKGAVNGIIHENLRRDTSENEPLKVDTSDLKGNSLEDFLKMQFEKEFKVEYPKIADRYLDERDFNQVVSILKERMFHSKEPERIVDKYLESYQQSVNEKQTNQLKELKAQFNRL